MTEKHFLFMKNNRVQNVAVFASQDEELADRIAHEQGYDDALWIGENPVPARWSLYDPTTQTFTAPDLNYLYSVGASVENEAMRDERIAKEQAEQESQQ